MFNSGSGRRDDPFAALARTKVLLSRFDLLLPDPAHPDLTFYSTRRDALACRGYDGAASRHQHDAALVVLALDTSAGHGAKMFNVLPQRLVESFVLALPPSRRNVYAMVDPALPLDAFFDLDCNLDALMDCFASGNDAGGEASSGTTTATGNRSTTVNVHTLSPHTPLLRNRDDAALVMAEALRTALQQRRPEGRDDDDGDSGRDPLLRFSRYCLTVATTRIVDGLERYFGVPVEAVGLWVSEDHDMASMAASVADHPPRKLGKLSAHVHVRMSQSRCFESLMQLRKCIHGFILPEWDAESAMGPSPVQAAPAGELAATTTTDRATALLERAIVRICVDDGVYTAWRAFRLPHCSKRRPDGSEGPTLEPLAVPLATRSTASSSIFALALINRHDDHVTPTAASRRATSGLPPPRPRSNDAAQELDDEDDDCAATNDDDAISVVENTERPSHATGTTSFVFQSAVDAAQRPPATTAVTDTSTQISVVGRPPPFKTGSREAVADPSRQLAVLLLFGALHPRFRDDIRSLTRIEFEDTSHHRAYYVFQKRCKFCPKAGRNHRSTYGQLYITYRSVKYRCYSNDCHESMIATSRA